MKTIQKLAALLLALLLACALAVPALAVDPSYSITVRNTPSTTNVSIVDKTFSAYKIFDVTYAGESEKTFAYTISKKIGTEDNPWFNAVLLYMGGGTNQATPNTNGVYTGGKLILTPGVDSDVYVVTTADAATGASLFDDDAARAFADSLTKWLNSRDSNAKPTPTGTAKGSKDTTSNSDSNSEKATISSLPSAGYYLVTGTSTPTDTNDNQTPAQEVVSAAALGTTDPTVTINLKAQAPTLDKAIVVGNAEAKGTSAQLGATVNFKLTSSVPDTTGYDSYTYLVTDTLSKGLTLNVAKIASNTFTVKVGSGNNAKTVSLTKADSDTNMTGDKFYIVENNDGTTTFKISLTMINSSSDAAESYTKGDPITIEYSATVNGNALTTDKETNTTILTYSSDPYSTTTSTTPEKKVYVYDFDVIVDKYTGNDSASNGSAKRLSGAKFVLYKEDNGNKNYYQLVKAYTYTDDGSNQVKVYSTDGKSYFSDVGLSTSVTAAEETTLSNGEAVKVNWVTDINKATELTTDENGKATFQGLETGNYKLHETVAPDGYNRLTEDVQVQIVAERKDNGEINTDTGTTTTVSSTNGGQYSITQKVENKSGSTLPSTGGMGTTLFYIIGGILVVVAGVLLVTKKRMDDGE